jgi:uncharacterized protein (TIGR00251 family)
MPAWLHESPEGCTLSFHVQPRAGRTGISGEHGGALKIRIAAAPVDGAANDALFEFLSKTLRVRRADVSLRSGESSRKKVVFVAGITAAEVQARLEA